MLLLVLPHKTSLNDKHNRQMFLLFLFIREEKKKKNIFTQKYKYRKWQNKMANTENISLLYSIASLVWVRPENLIHITCYIGPCQAAGGKTCLLHGLEKVSMNVGASVIHLPPPCRKKVLYGVEEGGICW